MGTLLIRWQNGTRLDLFGAPDSNHASVLAWSLAAADALLS
jgi:hypothetical protein